MRTTSDEGLTPNRDLDLLSAEVRERLAWLSRATRRIQLAGTEWLPSRRRLLNDGTLFREHREYAAGDEARHVDWHVFARRRELVSKVYEPEERARYAVLADLSGSVVASGQDKWRALRLMAAAFASVALRQGNPVSLAATERGGRGMAIKQYETPTQVGHILRDLNEVKVGGLSPLRSCVDRLTARGRRPAAWIVLSDFHPPRELESLLRQISSGRVLLIHPTSELELRPLPRGLRRIGDSESPARRWVFVTRRVSKRYAALVRAHRREVRSIARTYGAACFECDVMAPFDRTAAFVLHELAAGRLQVT